MDNYWVAANFGPSQVGKYDTATGNLVDYVQLDIGNGMVSSVAFGGPDYKSMLVTTGTNGMEDPKNEGGVALITFYDCTTGFAPGIAQI